ncbi:hypothetical protein ACFLYB_07235 [Chloroflexota bacterium]
MKLVSILVLILILITGCSSTTVTQTATETVTRQPNATTTIHRVETVINTISATQPFPPAFVVTEQVTFTLTQETISQWKKDYQVPIKNMTGLTKTAKVSFYFFDAQSKYVGGSAHSQEFASYEERTTEYVSHRSQTSGGQ